MSMIDVLNIVVGLPMNDFERSIEYLGAVVLSVITIFTVLYLIKLVGEWIK